MSSVQSLHSFATASVSTYAYDHVDVNAVLPPEPHPVPFAATHCTLAWRCVSTTRLQFSSSASSQGYCACSDPTWLQVNGLSKAPPVGTPCVLLCASCHWYVSLQPRPLSSSVRYRAL